MYFYTREKTIVTCWNKSQDVFVPNQYQELISVLSGKHFMIQKLDLHMKLNWQTETVNTTLWRDIFAKSTRVLTENGHFAKASFVVVRNWQKALDGGGIVEEVRSKYIWRLHASVLIWKRFQHHRRTKANKMHLGFHCKLQKLEATQCRIC